MKLLQELLGINETVDVAAYVVRRGKKFYIDREDEGKVITTPGQTVSFTHKGKTMQAVVSKRSSGRDDEVYELDIMND